MLLLSSATRILGTARPPAILHRASLSGCTAAARVPAFILLEHSRACASITPRWDCVANQYYPIAHYFWGIPTRENNKGCRPVRRTPVYFGIVTGSRKRLPRKDFLEPFLLLAAGLFFAVLLVSLAVRGVAGLTGGCRAAIVLRCRVSGSGCAGSSIGFLRSLVWSWRSRAVGRIIRCWGRCCIRFLLVGLSLGSIRCRRHALRSAR